jgi:hypothetical protein
MPKGPKGLSNQTNSWVELAQEGNILRILAIKLWIRFLFLMND